MYMVMPYYLWFYVFSIGILVRKLCQCQNHYLMGSLFHCWKEDMYPSVWAFKPMGYLVAQNPWIDSLMNGWVIEKWYQTFTIIRMSMHKLGWIYWRWTGVWLAMVFPNITHNVPSHGLTIHGVVFHGLTIHGMFGHGFSNHGPTTYRVRPWYGWLGFMLSVQVRIELGNGSRPSRWCNSIHNEISKILIGFINDMKNLFWIIE